MHKPNTEPPDADPRRADHDEKWGSVDDGALRALDQTASDLDQSASDRDQTSSDEDQTGSDRDQTYSDADQSASDEDQEASDRESAQGADEGARELGNRHRDHATTVRDKDARDRERGAVSREITAGERDETATTRAETADVRDASAHIRSQADGPPRLGGDSGADRTAQDRQLAADDRARAARDRDSAALDRTRAANDRGRAAEERAISVRERTLAAHDRAQAALDRETSETDELTNVRRRGPGMRQLQREIERAHRSAEELMLTFVDVDGLKAVNDSDGHQAGDKLLVAVANALKESMRSYDLVIRYGGDEFVCALPNADAESVSKRFERVSATLADGPTKASISVGIAPLNDARTAEELIRRADADLLARRAAR